MIEKVEELDTKLEPGALGNRKMSVLEDRQVRIPDGGSSERVAAEIAKPDRLPGLVCHRCYTGGGRKRLDVQKQARRSGKGIANQ